MFRPRFQRIDTDSLAQIKRSIQLFGISENLEDQQWRRKEQNSEMRGCFDGLLSSSRASKT